MKKMMAITMCMMMLMSLFSGMAFAEESTLPKIDMTKWQYEASDDVYWQVGLSYAANMRRWAYSCPARTSRRRTTATALTPAK